MKKIFASASAAALLTGCLGQNALFDTVQDWNATATNNKFVNQGISFVFWWVPVYGLSLLGDIIIFNSIEFWTGTNPISKPLLAHINDNADDWARLWQTQVELGIIPYYMFVERDTGARHYFEVPLAKAWQIYRDAMKQVSGIARTARGPSMSSHPGKVEIQGVTEINGEKVFALRFIQGRNHDWVQRPFFAKYNEDATWLNHLEPAFGEEKFFFEDELAEMESE